MAIRVVINGAHGKMGQETVKAVQGQPDLELVGKIGIEDDLRAAILASRPHVVIDFTAPNAVFTNTQTIIELNIHPVIGTTGLSAEQIKKLQQQCLEKRLGGIIAPNFSLGAVLLMRYARDAARYFPQVEIIEYHHDGKEDSPSGTAIKTAEMIAETRHVTSTCKPSHETIAGARGANHHDIPIHAIRLPGIVADQAVIFGSKGETLTLSHRSIHREAFMPGVIMACRKVISLKKLVYGLENIL